jgi:hypothetical protein
MCYKYIVSVIAISAVTLIEIYALTIGVNGTALSLSVACIGGLGGYNLKKVMGENEKQSKHGKGNAFPEER